MRRHEAARIFAGDASSKPVHLCLTLTWWQRRCLHQTKCTSVLADRPANRLVQCNRSVALGWTRCWRVESLEALSVLHGKHVASRMQCELIRIHITWTWTWTWAFVESNNHCDLNQKALMVAFRLSRNKCQALVDPVHPDLCTPWCTLIAVYIDNATDTAHARFVSFRTSTILYTAA